MTKQGFVNTTEMVLIATIVLLGAVVGLTVFRDAVLQELGDSGAAVGQADQSYSVGVLANGADPTVTTQITVAADVVNLRRDFGSVEVQGSFNNFDYRDETDIGDGDDTANTLPPGIVQFDPAAQEGT